MRVSEDQLVSELWAWDVRFLMGASESGASKLSPDQIIAGLANSLNSRVRLSLIPFLLRHPETADQVLAAEKNCNKNALQILWCYYTAAVILQNKHRDRLRNIFGEQTSLPDLFSNKLGLVLEHNPNDLERLATRHQILSGQKINWLGTYKHAAERFLTYMEKFT